MSIIPVEAIGCTCINCALAGAKPTARKVDNPECAKIHTPCPDEYLAWHEWAEQMSKKYGSVRCPHCSKFAVWIPKAKAKKINDAEQKRIDEAEREMEKLHRATQQFQKRWINKRKAPPK